MAEGAEDGGAPRGADGGGAWTLVRAPAKVNLYLEVLGRRADGYHELDGLMAALDWGDEVWLRASARPGVRLEVSGDEAGTDVPADEGNLAWRAAAEVLDALGARAAAPGLEIRLVKRIPSGAGLGGGSSDAAAVVRAAPLELGAQLAPEHRDALLKSLGSDCTFFESGMETGLARCKGRGDEVCALPVESAGWWVALVVPGVRCATRDVYAALSFPLSGTARCSSVPVDLLEMSEANARARLFNRLEQVALAESRELRGWRELLDRTNARHFRLSGSGSAFFGLFCAGERARSALDDIQRAAASERLALRGVWLTRLLGPAGTV